ncbi:MAG: FAD-binding oxidoreductase [Planctomycetes bacterium]|nr:FAD-binding oxidoreductase [Planctomycetota bacterium]
MDSRLADRRGLDPESLALLREALGEDLVDAREVTRDAYARDLSALGHLAFRRPDGLRPPDAVARPRDVAGVQAVLRLANERGFAVIPFGAGSGVCGGTIAVRGGVALDLKGLDRILEVDRRSLLVRVQAGVNGQLFEEALQREGLTAAHHPSSITCSTVGGWVAARGAGQLSTRYGKVEDMVVALEVVLPDGTLVATPPAPRAATGPDWNQLFTGSEGLLGVIVAATLRVHRLPPLRLFRSHEFPDLTSALEAVREGLQRGARPAAVRLYDPLDTLLVARSGDPRPVPAPDQGVDDDAPLAPWWPLSRVSPGALLRALAERVPDLRHGAERALLARPELLNRLTARIPGVGCLLVLTFEGHDPDLVGAEEAVFRRACEAHGGEDRGPRPAETWWNNRLAVSFKQSGVYAMGGFVDTMEVATSWTRLLELHDRVRAALAPHALVMAHFSHAYADGCSIYFTFAALQGDPDDARARHAAAWEAGLGAVVACGAAVSHHHGVGLLKGEALRASHGPLHDLLARVKGTLDPRGVMNPGKLGLP